jgi:hypothetical protein
MTEKTEKTLEEKRSILLEMAARSPQMQAVMVAVAKLEEEHLARTEDEVAAFRAKQALKFNIMDPKLNVRAGRDDYILVGAFSGEGKTTILIESAARVLMQNKKVLFLAAEEGATQVMSRFFSVLCKQNIPREMLSKYLKNNLLIVDSKNSQNQITCFDRIFEIMCEKVSVFQPDIIHIDNINTLSDVYYDINNKDKRFNTDQNRAKYEYFSKQIKHLINMETNFPPIVMAQQLKGMGGTHNPEKPQLMQLMLSEATKTFKDATFAFCILRDKENDRAFVHIGKDRSGFVKKWKHIVKFNESTCLLEVVPEDTGGLF